MSEVRNLRERTRRAVRTEITEAAERLFTERGYDATTIDDIAAEVGMSSRSVFRYFATKEDLLIGKFDNAADALLTALQQRPTGEPLWASLRAAFDVFVPDDSTPDKAQMASRIHEVVFETPAVFGRYLQKLQRLQDDIETLVRARDDSGASYAMTDPTLRAVIGAAFACLLAAQRTWLYARGADTFTRILDRAMTAIPILSRPNKK
ncbi:TetR family transcriptional regulator [Mycolicibacterium canariasense]|uniref:TetR family transcriptional regulator n=1 Tax=Mycolicibacterium canariasense TaxID=228230 RepID=A0A117IAN0_MYCCR|nr:TetR/AcrR family transcriptional regulator [Mycolicibacterium canariasense]MCV7211076.1 TetR family transcriptional regulator [Mycolicibacterium canariasense]ORV08017.1 hypothetical protein AWB94_13565 [Mycolicibacterium canariasense]GAS96633.1 TetR family transcriptional regulator [Mycolicibacterium canariasense]